MNPISRSVQDAVPAALSGPVDALQSAVWLEYADLPAHGLQEAGTGVEHLGLIHAPFSSLGPIGC